MRASVDITTDSSLFILFLSSGMCFEMMFNKYFAEPVLLQAEHAHAHNANPHFSTINLSASKLL